VRGDTEGEDTGKCVRGLLVLWWPDKCWLGLRAMTMMWLRKGNIANVMCWGITPLSLEHEGRSSIFYCARSFGIIGGTGRTIFDSLAIGGGGR
jgi:hypothetical protein